MQSPARNPMARRAATDTHLPELRHRHQTQLRRRHLRKPPIPRLLSDHSVTNLRGLLHFVTRCMRGDRNAPNRRPQFRFVTKWLLIGSHIDKSLQAARIHPPSPAKP